MILPEQFIERLVRSIACALYPLLNKVCFMKRRGILLQVNIEERMKEKTNEKQR